jgi:hypothetical protein
MSVKINVGVNKKIGLPDYGSAGSLCTIEIDADNIVLNNPDQFLDRVRDAFEVARIACEEELAHHRVSKGTGQSHSYQGNGSSNREPESKREYRSEYRSNNSSTGEQSSGQKYVATAKQLNYIFQLCKSVNGLDKRRLEKYCDHRWGRGTAQLTPKQASELIDILRNGGEEAMSV